jgi:outer membrane receptor protein involved in Fe transport
MRKLIAVVVLFVSAFLCGSAWAQTSKGTIAGDISDPSGVLANASVTAINQDTQETRTVTSGPNGSFRIDAINPGTYTIKVTASGYSESITKDIVVNPSVTTSFNPRLQAGAVSDVVTVEAHSNQINTENGQISAVVSGQEISQLPIFSLNPIELATTVPGVQFVQQGGLSNGFNLEVNGLRPRANNYLIDGQDINDNSIGGQGIQPQIPDAYSNLSILTNAYSSEYGRGGGAVVNLITRSGTNKYHGEVYDIYTGSGLNAKDGQSRLSPDTSKTRFDTHNIGFTVGGPIIKNKLFGFGAATFFRFYGQAQPAPNFLPDADGLAVLKFVGGPNVDLLNKFLLNGAYLNTFSQGSGKLAGDARTLHGRGAGCPNGCVVTMRQFTRPSPAQLNPDSQYVVKVDYTPRQSDTISFRYLHDKGSLSPDFFNFPNTLPGFDTQQGGPSDQGGVVWTHVFSPTLVNEFRVSETRINFSFDATPALKANPLVNSPTIAISGSGLPTFGFNGALPQGRGHDTYQLQDTVSYTRGRQTFRIGADIGRFLNRDFIPFNSRGALTFNSGGTGFGSLDNFVDNFLGVSGSATLSFGSPRADLHVWQTAYFVQDDIKLTPELTVNLGLRYEYQNNPENRLKFPAVDLNNLSAPIDTVSKVKEDKNNFGPRIGLAYAPSNGPRFLADGKTVYRAAGGIFYDVVFTNITDNSQGSAPNATGGTITSTSDRGVADGTGQIANITPVLNPRSSVTSVASNQINPMTYQVNAGFERALPGNLKLAVNYVYTRGEKLFLSRQFNYFGGFGQPRLNPNRGAINLRGNFADSNYNGLVTELTHAFGHGFFVTGTYTYGKALDTGSEVFGLFNAGDRYSQDLGPNGLASEYGRSAYDHTHYGSIAYFWDLPSLHSSNHMADNLLNVFTRHFSISGVTQWQSGQPGTINFAGLDNNGDGDALNGRPTLSNPRAPFASAALDCSFNGGTIGTYCDIASGNMVDPSLEHFLIKRGGFGNVGRDNFVLPGTQVYNVAVQKGIPVSFSKRFESAQVVLRAEAQDIGNHNNVGVLDTNLLDISTDGTTNSYASASHQPSFLDKSSVRIQDGRQLRLWVKFVF